MMRKTSWGRPGDQCFVVSASVLILALHQEKFCIGRQLLNRADIANGRVDIEQIGLVLWIDCIERNAWGNDGIDLPRVLANLFVFTQKRDCNQAISQKRKCKRVQRRRRQSCYASVEETFCRRAKAANAGSPASIIRRTTMPLDRAQAWQNGARRPELVDKHKWDSEAEQKGKMAAA